MISGKTFYEILGVSPKATQAEIVETFRRQVKEGHPDRFPEEEKKREAERFLKEITEAFNTLSRPALRARYDESLASPQAEVVRKSPQEQVRELLQQGKARQRLGDLAGALACFDHALRLEPAHSEALFLAGMVRLKNPRWRAQGSLQVERAIALAPFASEYAAEYARFLLENDQKLRAQRLLEKALESSPADDRLLTLLAQARSEKPGGGFSLFGKK
jgi:curved DNA-binding protein CbpA